MAALRYCGVAMLGLVLFATGSLPGCGARPAGFERYVPEAARAQAALDRALAAWKNGGPPKQLALSDPEVAVEVADGFRRPGQRLADYEIVGEVAADGPRCFVVRLMLEQPSQQIDTRYYVAGIDPLWVFRQEDYDLIMHWEKCDDETSEAAASAPSGAPSSRAGTSGATR